MEPHKTENFCKAKDTVLHTNGKPSYKMKKILTNSTPHIGIMCKVLKEVMKLYTKKTNNPIYEHGAYLHRWFSVEETQMAVW